MSANETVLVVDDEAVSRDLIRPYLEAEGFAVLEARHGAEALELLRRGGVDLVLLDVMLPGEDGFSVLRQLRSFSDIPVIMLTARRDEPYRIAGLRQGADDYVVKPFSPAEVVARAAANLRRARDASSPDQIQIGGLVVDLASRTASADGEDISLTRREFDLLAALSKRPGRVLTRETLLQLVWGTDYLTPKTVDVHVSTLRKKLGDAVTIASVRGVGYRLDAP